LQRYDKFLESEKKIEFFSRARVDENSRVWQSVFVESGEISPFRNVLPIETVEVFICTTFPRHGPREPRLPIVPDNNGAFVVFSHNRVTLQVPEMCLEVNIRWSLVMSALFGINPLY
jgi:hypothetical protein